MSFFFKKKPSELCKLILKNLRECHDNKIDDEPKINSENVTQLRVMLYGDEKNSAKIQNIQKIRDELINNDLFFTLVDNMHFFDIQGKNEIVKIFNFFLRRGRQNSIVDYFCSQTKITDSLVDGTSDSRISTHCGPILRECIMHKDIASIVLDIKYVERMFMCVNNPVTDEATDAFATLRLLLTEHKSLVQRFLEANYNVIFQKFFRALLSSDNFLTLKKTLQLLHDILLEKKNQRILFNFVNDVDHLKLLMNLLRSRKLSMQYAVFDVFKLFVANTRKSPQVSKILLKNREILSEFIKKLSKESDPEFEVDKVYLLEQLNELQKQSQDLNKGENSTLVSENDSLVNDNNNE